MGKSYQIRDRHFLITGASGAFGSAIKGIIEQQGGIVRTVKFKRDFTYSNYHVFDKLLSKADVLILAHGSKYENAMAANHDSFVTIIEKFIEYSRGRGGTPEVWGLGSEIELHGTFGFKSLAPYCASKRKYACAAKRYYLSTNIIYRHIVPAAFSSAMGPGLMSAKFAAAWAVFLINYGFKYVPISYTGIAYLNYFRFRLLRPAGECQ